MGEAAASRSRADGTITLDQFARLVGGHVASPKFLEYDTDLAKARVESKAIAQHAKLFQELYAATGGTIAFTKSFAVEGMRLVRRSKSWSMDEDMSEKWSCTQAGRLRCMARHLMQAESKKTKWAVDILSVGPMGLKTEPAEQANRAKRLKQEQPADTEVAADTYAEGEESEEASTEPIVSDHGEATAAGKPDPAPADAGPLTAPVFWDAENEQAWRFTDNGAMDIAVSIDTDGPPGDFAKAVFKDGSKQPIPDLSNEVAGRVQQKLASVPPARGAGFFWEGEHVVTKNKIVVRKRVHEGIDLVCIGDGPSQVCNKN